MHGAAASGERGPMEAAGDNDDVNNHHRIASITTKVGRATMEVMAKLIVRELKVLIRQ